jgi:hypothetical protein
MPHLADRAGKDSRASVYRLLRYMVNDSQGVVLLNEWHIDMYIVRYACYTHANSFRMIYVSEAPCTFI